MQDIAVVTQSNTAVGLDVLYFYIFVHIHHVLAVGPNLMESELQANNRPEVLFCQQKDRFANLQLVT